MPKSKTYRVSFCLTQHWANDANQLVQRMTLGQPDHPSMAPPNIEAAGLPDLLAKLAKLAEAVPVTCRPLVSCLSPPKPPGFDDAMRGLYFHMDKITSEKVNPFADIAKAS
jgi:hypothetical protein